MKPALWCGAVVLAVMLPLCLAAQDATSQLKDFTRTLKAADGLQVSLIHLNARTLPIIFQAPTLYAMRARAVQSTLLYVQGTTQREVELDTSVFALEQDGQSTAGQTLNIKNFQTGTVPTGTQVDGLIEFPKRVDLSKAFRVRHGRDSVEFRFNASQVKEATGAPAPAAPQN